MGEITNLGPSGLLFFNSGAVTFCLAYFIYEDCTAKRIEGKGNNIVSRFLSKFFNNNPDGTTNWRGVIAILANCFIIIGIFMAVLTSLGLAIKAGINIGLVVSIWAIGPFLAALLDLFCYRVPMQTFHIIGMIAMLTCAILISLSGGPPVEDATNVVKEAATTVAAASKDLIPAWIPILFAPVMPLVCTGQVAA